jgi:hypothetical protein
MKRKLPPPVAADVAGLRAWLLGLWTPFRTFFEGRFVWLALLPIAVLIYRDRELLKTWIGLLLVLVVLCGVAFQIRKVLMPADRYGRLEDFARKALEDPVGAAIVFAACVLLMLGIVAVGVLWLGGLRG